MLKDITLGQFFPGDTLLHRLDPRVKLCVTMLYIVALFFCEGPISYCIMTALLIAAILTSKIPMRTILKSLRPIMILLLITTLFNLFYMQGGNVLFEWKFIHITDYGIYNAIFLIVRIVLLITSTFVMLTYTTSPIMLTDAIESLLSPLKKIRIPVHELAMMMSIALRFIPTLLDETDKILSAQKSRGADFESGSIFNRAKALVPILIPLFISAFRRAEDLAIAMESRCYRGGKGRTRLRTLKMHRSDAFVLALVILIIALAITVRYTVSFGILTP